MKSVMDILTIKLLWTYLLSSCYGHTYYESLMDILTMKLSWTYLLPSCHGHTYYEAVMDITMELLWRYLQ